MRRVLLSACAWQPAHAHLTDRQIDRERERERESYTIIYLPIYTIIYLSTPTIYRVERTCACRSSSG